MNSTNLKMLFILRDKQFFYGLITSRECFSGDTYQSIARINRERWKSTLSVDCIYFLTNILYDTDKGKMWNGGVA